MSDHDESDPFGETRSAETGLAEGGPAEGGLSPFEAFKAARPKEPPAPEPFPEPFGGEVPGTGEAEPTAVIIPEPTAYGPVPGEYAGSSGYAGSSQYARANEYTATYPTQPGFGYAEPMAMPMPMGDPGQGSAQGGGRGRMRSVVLFGGVAVLAVGLGAGVYAATQSSSGNPAASSGTTASAPASPGASKAAKGARTETVRLTVTAVNGDAFTGTTPGGETVTAQIAAATKFGTAARPFTRAQLVPGAVVYARLRRTAGGSVVATVIAAGTSDKASGAAAASPSAGA